MHETTELQHLNFVITGLPRSGAYSLSQAINQCPKAICHTHILDADMEERQFAHLDYFGECPHTLPWGPGDRQQPSLERYLTETVMRKPQRFELACGAFLSAKMVDSHNLYPLLARWSQSDDFAFIRVLRNPVESFISLKQAEQTAAVVGDKAWVLRPGSEASKPRGVFIEPEELTIYVDWAKQAEDKTRASLHYQTMTVTHRRIVTDWWGVMTDIFYFLELPQHEAPLPVIQRYPHRSLTQRCSNWDMLKNSVRYDIRELMQQAEREEV